MPLNRNPYSCTRPGNMFVGYTEMRESIYRGFINDNSYAVLGGRRCGKTSLLMRIEKDLGDLPTEPFKMLPRRFSMQGMDRPSPSLLFEKIYTLCIKDIDAPPWEKSDEAHAFRAFLDHLKRAVPAIQKEHGPDWLVVLLIDELDGAIDQLPGDQFFQNIRHLLMESDFHRHFRVVATGVKDMARLISSGSSPLNNLRNLHLRVLKGKQAEQLVKTGFDGKYDTETLMFLFELTGKHPFLLQGVLEKLWEAKSEWTKSTVKKAAKQFLKEHRTFQRWAEEFDTPEQIVYNCLAASPDGSMHIRDIKGSLSPDLRPKVDDALNVLAYHGVINDDDEDEPEIAGTLFRKRFLEKTLADMLALFQELQKEVSAMPLDSRIREKAEDELNKAVSEIKTPESGSHPDPKTLQSSFESATGTLKAAGGTAVALAGFIDKAHKLGPLMGMTAESVAKLFS